MNELTNFRLSDLCDKQTLRKNIEFFIVNNLSYIDETNSISNKISKLLDEIFNNLELWLNSDIPIKFKEQIIFSIKQKKWNDLIEAFGQELSFGTSGIRGKLITSTEIDEERNDLKHLEEFGINAKILRGPNTINEITICNFTLGLVKYLQKHNMKTIVLGCDSRINNKLFLNLIIKILLSNDLIVYYFDKPTPISELAFAVKYLKANLGIEITASHNDKRYNGLKLITSNAGPPNDTIRNQIAQEIFSNNNANYLLIDKLNNFRIDKHISKNLICLDSINTDCDVEIEKEYINQIKNILFQPELIQKYNTELKIGYSAIHGTGYNIVSKLFNEFGIHDISYILSMNKPNSLFPSFKINQILDPGDIHTSTVIINEFLKQYSEEKLQNLDLLMYNDPDADRLGVITKVPQNEQKYYGKWKLYKANEIWTLLLWYMLEIFSKNHPEIKYHDLFIVKSYLTSDSLSAISKKYSVECIDGHVGFSDLSDIVQKKWLQNKINIGMFEESNGFSFAGNPSMKNFTSHLLEKDGILALMLLIEITAFAKSNNISINSILDNIYMDPCVGYFATFRTQIPEEDMFEGIVGEFNKLRKLKIIEKIADDAKNRINSNIPLIIGGIPVTRVEKYSTGKYDNKYWSGFADEGIRFFLNSETTHLTIRSSGTESKIRIFSQYNIKNLDKKHLPEEKFKADKFAESIANEMKNKINS